MKSQLEETLALQIRAARLPKPEREYRFSHRRYRFDFAWPEFNLAVECQGGIWTGGRHNRPQGFRNDCEKRNTATMAGWRVLEYTHDMISSGMALQDLESIVGGDRQTSGIDVQEV